jgi:hypothetical protein
MVKALLIRGADRTARDNQGNLPVDLIPPSMDENLKKELR